MNQVFHTHLIHCGTILHCLGVNACVLVCVSRGHSVLRSVFVTSVVSRAMRTCACLGYLAAALVVVALSCDGGVVEDECYQLLLAPVQWILKASHLCCRCMTCDAHTPGSPSAADEAWYWPKRVLRIGQDRYASELKGRKYNSVYLVRRKLNSMQNCKSDWLTSRPKVA